MIIYRLRNFSENKNTEFELKRKLRRGCDRVSKPIAVVRSNRKRKKEGLPRKRSYQEMRELVSQKQELSDKLYKAATNPSRTLGNIGGGLVETVGKEPLKGAGLIGAMYVSKGTAPTALTTAVVDKAVESNPVTSSANHFINKSLLGRLSRSVVEKTKPQENFTKTGEMLDRPIKKGIKWILKRI